jgi:hypothetical protein
MYFRSLAMEMGVIPNSKKKRLDGEPEFSLAVVEPPAQQLQAPLVDWDILRIEESQDKERRIEIVDDEVMYELLWFKAEDEEADKARPQRRQPRMVALNRMAILGKLIQLGQPLLLMTIYQGRGLGS